MSDWRHANDLITRSALWMREKTGPWKDHHRVECQCRGCCGESLSWQIHQWNKTNGEEVKC